MCHSPLESLVNKDNLKFWTDQTHSKTIYCITVFLEYNDEDLTDIKSK